METPTSMEELLIWGWPASDDCCLPRQATCRGDGEFHGIVAHQLCLLVCKMWKIMGWCTRNQTYEDCSLFVFVFVWVCVCVCVCACVCVWTIWTDVKLLLCFFVNLAGTYFLVTRFWRALIHTTHTYWLFVWIVAAFCPRCLPEKEAASLRLKGPRLTSPMRQETRKELQQWGEVQTQAESSVGRLAYYWEVVEGTDDQEVQEGVGP